jgi:E3 ubiquitin-protein ligase SHPRH
LHDRTAAAPHQQALDLLTRAEEETERIIGNIRAALAAHKQKGEVLKQHAAAIARDAPDDVDTDAPSAFDDDGKRKASREASAQEEDEKLGLPKTPAGEAHIARGTGLRLRLRECLITHHEVMFFKGNAYHMLGEAYANEEANAYASADRLRRDLLSGTSIPLRRYPMF